MTVLEEGLFYSTVDIVFKIVFEILFKILFKTVLNCAPGVIAVAEDPEAVVVEVGAGEVVAGVAHRAVLAPVGVEDGRAVRPLELQVLVQVLEPDPVPLRLPGCQFN